MKVAIVGGAGGVGSSAAFNLLLAGGAAEVVLIDNRPEMITSHVMDLEQALEQGGTGSVRGGEQEDVVDADVVVMAAGAPLSVNTSRMVYLEDNARIMEQTLDLLDPSWGGILLVVTNPVDPLCTWAQQRSGLDRRRVIGYTLNDTLRLRTGIAKALGVEIGSVEAWVIGEHGDNSVPLYDRVQRRRARRSSSTPSSWSPRRSSCAPGTCGTWRSTQVARPPGPRASA